VLSRVSHGVPGAAFLSGALGHGLSFGIAGALPEKPGGHHLQVFVVMSDGELDGGSNWEFDFVASTPSWP
jgi:transketolase